MLGWIEFAIIAGTLVLVARLTKRPLEILAGRNVWIDEATRLAAKLAELRASTTDVVVERDHWKAEAKRLGKAAAELSEKVSAMRAKGKRVVADRDRWEMQAKALTERLAEARGAYDDPAAAREDKFTAAKRAFARHFHPNNSAREGLEKTLRTEIFKDFWPIIEAIEQEKPIAR